MPFAAGIGLLVAAVMEGLQAIRNRNWSGRTSGRTAEQVRERHAKTAIICGVLAVVAFVFYYSTGIGGPQ